MEVNKYDILRAILFNFMELKNLTNHTTLSLEHF